MKGMYRMKFEISSPISDEQLSQLQESLKFLHISELKDICKLLNITCKGKKPFMVSCILTFLKTGEVLSEPNIPSISRVPKGKKVPLSLDSLILKGDYKNDLKTRYFFKSIIGEHFHFTAFAIDWINARWIEGNPPTYEEYAKIWVQEMARRKKYGSKPKEEWAYINFIQKLKNINPSISRDEIINEWNMTRRKNKRTVQDILGITDE